jgi:hypothetical protein
MSASDREFQLQMLEEQTTTNILTVIFSFLAATAFSIFVLIYAVLSPIALGGPSLIVGNITSGNVTWTGSFTQNATVYTSAYSSLSGAALPALLVGAVSLAALMIILGTTKRRINRIRRRFVG